MGQGDSASVLIQAKVWKMREYWMYFPFFILHDWGKRSAEARCPHLSGVALIFLIQKRATALAVAPGKERETIPLPFAPLN